MANPFRQMFPDSKCINTIQVNVPLEVYRKLAEEAQKKHTSISEILLLSLKKTYFSEESTVSL